MINVLPDPGVITFQGSRGASLQLGMKSRILTDGTGRTQRLKDCSVCLPPGEYSETVRLARVLEPESWSEFDAGKGTCTNMTGHRILISIQQARRALDAGYRRSPNTKVSATARR